MDNTISVCLLINVHCTYIIKKRFCLWKQSMHDTWVKSYRWISPPRPFSNTPWSDEPRELDPDDRILAARIIFYILTCKKTFREEHWVVISTGPLTGTVAHSLPGSITPPCLPRPVFWPLPAVPAEDQMITVKMYGLVRIDSEIKPKQTEASTVNEVPQILEHHGLPARALYGCIILINGKNAN